ncbi:hypothetical protein N566_20485 [Streptomycetaceae bacterium MP113-05]|nr:hypothetical protein N566_20485 [Streptomycetaceae bacterium MP113-05]
MRAFLATSLGVLSTATLLLQPAAAVAVSGDAQARDTAHQNQSPTAPVTGLPGSTQSLPLAPVAADEPTDTRRSGRAPHPDAGRSGDQARRSASPSADIGLERRTVRPFSLVGIVWEDPGEQLDAEVSIRTRNAATGRWSGWRPLATHGEHAPGLFPEDQEDAALRGSTPPLWVGRSDGVQVRVHVEDGTLPAGMRLELVDPGDAPARTADASGRSTPGAPAGGGAQSVPEKGEPTVGTTGSKGPEDTEGAEDSDAAKSPDRLPALTEKETVADAVEHGLDPEVKAAGGKEHVGPRPGIVIRDGWGADADLREGGFVYGNDVKAAFVHHTAGSNGYTCKEAPNVIRGIYRYHVKSLGWRDIGYNFLIDKCGTIYEGRAGGVIEPVRGAHTLGFNSSSMGVAVLGNFEQKEPSKEATDAIAKLTAWKLGLYDVNANSSTRLTSEGGKYRKGDRVKMHTIAGHRDGFATACPGRQLYDELGAIRELAAELQGR